MFESQIPTIVTLTKGCKSVEVVRNLHDVPAGCGSIALTPTIAVHVLVRVISHSMLHNQQTVFSCVISMLRVWSIWTSRLQSVTRN